jgi:hypothetical protein
MRIFIGRSGLLYGALCAWEVKPAGNCVGPGLSNISLQRRASPDSSSNGATWNAAVVPEPNYRHAAQASVGAPGSQDEPLCLGFTMVFSGMPVEDLVHFTVHLHPVANHPELLRLVCGIVITAGACIGCFFGPEKKTVGHSKFRFSSLFEQ